jgi:thioredoxin 1
LGANWCPDAQCLEAVMQLPSVAQFIAEHYEVIRVDLGEYDINMDLIKYLGMPSQEGIPRVFILDLQGEPINLETNDKWRSARQSYPQDIFDYFQSFIKKRPST